MGTIVVIGGGELIELETLEIDRKVVQLTQKAKPKALFIPTASSDATGYCDTFSKVYGDILGCETSHLLLVSQTYTHDEITDLITAADLIYVGGGNTRKMLEIWKNTGVDTLLKEAYSSGTVLAGLSAGSICWFEYGHSDSEAFDDQGNGSISSLKPWGFCRAFIVRIIMRIFGLKILHAWLKVEVCLESRWITIVQSSIKIRNIK